MASHAPAAIDLSLIGRALIVDTPWIDEILDRGKTWEMRTRATRVRGPIGLIQSRTGTLVGVASVAASLGPFDEGGMLANIERHRIPADMVRGGAVAKWRHAWVLEGAARLAEPVRYVHPHGAVIWVTLDPATRGALAAARLLPTTRVPVHAH